MPLRLGTAPPIVCLPTVGARLLLYDLAAPAHMEDRHLAISGAALKRFWLRIATAPKWDKLKT